MDTKVNDQITDAVTQANVKVLGEAPAVAMGNLYQAMAHSTGILFQNAVSAQNQQNILAQAATTQGVMQIYSIDTVADAISITKILNPGS
ncbi:RebB family R body protein [Chryseobacterium gambrini]|uniref:RebB family R body protein n=2 Tax=Chryseobacterium TaxID=59732 RepID=A0AAJ1R9J1_9FLAO|nr:MULTISPECIES: RebB family R body protein [Chryseobacterium]MBL7880332.1 RebB family R body protein [Chryseobacterium gambrini]MDN4014724.1 RebB family R body protein [Chryseobacterium gambrini]MDO3426030.1 RebB family R body protein [Chryseobacterium sp. APV1]QWA38014.1 RebB family R body protein [Chryseobacterium sp. ZHDP1]